ncbi:hypothetical protein [Vibrio alginolyticus]|jgi:hypothetical protein|uniref:hypothetical protein n=1 Tax=Vibrio alginolyticus TaxID=663 RepID=UPI001BD5946B|nr:hypothetical protein [Vibrio alginolyticus]MBT0017983.1 hypothetical protein [Vibrio alginolyticus]
MPIQKAKQLVGYIVVKPLRESKTDRKKPSVRLWGSATTLGLFIRKLVVSSTGEHQFRIIP